MKQTNDIFIVGTDTGVGKTVLSLLLMQYFYATGYSPFYMKPIQTGCKNPQDTDSDARFIYRHVKPLVNKDPAESVIYCFKKPKAPYFAARNEGKEIDIKTIQSVVAAKSALYSPVIMEAAGGLLVPVNEKLLVIDLISLTGTNPLIAARASLGTINHTLLTVEALMRRDIQPLGIVFIDAGELEPSPEMVQENIEAVEKGSGIKVAGVIGYIKDFSNPPQSCYQPFERIFGRNR
jgi:dethiobiotin synthetase